MDETSSNTYPEHFNSLLEAVTYFDSESKAIKYLQNRRWKGNPKCPHCGCSEIWYFSDNKRFKCKSCKKQFTVTVGTIFENSKVPLVKWFIAIYLCTSHKKGLSSHQLAKHLKVTQKTAWFMLHRIRHLLGIDNKQDEPMDEIVHVDETYVGGRNSNRHKDKKFKYGKGREFSDKTPIVGLIDGNGKARTIVTKDVKTITLIPLILKNVIPGSILVTDDHKPYRRLRKDYYHEVVKHGYGEYMNEFGFTTNCVEGFWTWIKRMIMGTYHSVKRKYLQYYANEATFRYNTRNLTDSERLSYILGMNNGNLRYRILTE